MQMLLEWRKHDISVKYSSDSINLHKDIKLNHLECQLTEECLHFRLVGWARNSGRSTQRSEVEEETQYCKLVATLPQPHPPSPSSWDVAFFSLMHALRSPSAIQSLPSVIQSLPYMSALDTKHFTVDTLK